jgi:hypothetical protein
MTRRRSGVRLLKVGRAQISFPKVSRFPPTKKQLGISGREITDARLIRDAEVAKPGIVKRVEGDASEWTLVRTESNQQVVVLLQNAYGRLLTETGRPKEALPYLEGAYTAAQVQFGPENHITVVMGGNLARVNWVRTRKLSDDLRTRSNSSRSINCRLHYAWTASTDTLPIFVASAAVSIEPCNWKPNSSDL